MKRRLVTFVLGLVAVSCGGGSGSPGIPQTEACAQAAKAACTKIFSCPALLLFQVGLQTEPACEGMIMQNCGSTGFQCSANQTYHADKALQCRDEFNRKTCDTVAADISAAGVSISAAVSSLTSSIPACGQICTGAGDAGTTAPGG